MKNDNIVMICKYFESHLINRWLIKGIKTDYKILGIFKGKILKD